MLLYSSVSRILVVVEVKWESYIKNLIHPYKNNVKKSCYWQLKMLKEILIETLNWFSEIRVLSQCSQLLAACLPSSVYIKNEWMNSLHSITGWAEHPEEFKKIKITTKVNKAEISNLPQFVNFRSIHDWLGKQAGISNIITKVRNFHTTEEHKKASIYSNSIHRGKSELTPVKSPDKQ